MQEARGAQGYVLPLRGGAWSLPGLAFEVLRLGEVQEGFLEEDGTCLASVGVRGKGIPASGTARAERRQGQGQGTMAPSPLGLFGVNCDDVRPGHEWSCQERVRLCRAWPWNLAPSTGVAVP